MKLCGKLEMFPKYLKGLFCAQNRVFWIWEEFSLQCFPHPSFAVQIKNPAKFHWDAYFKACTYNWFSKLAGLVCKFELVRACHKHFYVTSTFTKWQPQWAKPITHFLRARCLDCFYQLMWFPKILCTISSSIFFLLVGRAGTFPKRRQPKSPVSVFSKKASPETFLEMMIILELALCFDAC